MQGQTGNADITIANIESDLPEDDGDENYEDVEDEEGEQELGD